MEFSALPLVTLLVTATPQALGQPLLASPLLAVIHEDAACEFSSESLGTRHLHPKVPLVRVPKD